MTRSGTTKTRRLALLLAIAITITIQPSFGAGKKKPKPSPTPPAAPLIAAIGPNSVTVNAAGGSVRTFTVTSFTEITVNGQRSTLAELKPGMTADVSIGMDPTQARRITASGSPGGGQAGKK